MLTISGYADEEEAVADDIAHYLKDPAPGVMAPFDGCKLSGDCREEADRTVARFLEAKAALGVAVAHAA